MPPSVWLKLQAPVLKLSPNFVCLHLSMAKPFSNFTCPVPVINERSLKAALEPRTLNILRETKKLLISVHSCQTDFLYTAGRECGSGGGEGRTGWFGGGLSCLNGEWTFV